MRARRIAVEITRCWRALAPLMRRGIILRRDLPVGLALSTQQTQELAQHVLDGLCALHAIDVEAAGLSQLIRPFVLAGCPEGGTVLDPFGGSGTTGLVADQHGRNAILIDIDERNLPMARERIGNDTPLFTSVEVAA